ncbi:tetraspanin-6-like [Neocloeon triangulifer]|uniref:tetraspanin-6-like n=1 Tax=Neocloeon triangulifer TaxID=2078957 RepID=UPI00286FAAE3|nr:tetraspanin-6-like [Neocloeon triangulifer]XP_059482329.1 tetraspanin-6-like [Neocloeon triangulifer]
MASNHLKNTFHALNILLLASAIIEIVIAAVIYGKVYRVDLLSSLKSASAEIVLMTSGVLVIVCAVFSIYSANKDIGWILYLCGVITFANFVLQIAGFSMSFHFMLVSEVKSWMDHTFANIDEMTFARNSWDRMQNTLSCCGISGSSDWLKNRNGMPGTIPSSCSCKMGLDENCKSGPNYEVGCLSTIQWLTFDLAAGVAGLAAAMAFIQFIVGVLTFILARRASKQSMRI